jgi:signal transduction histidine kinase
MPATLRSVLARYGTAVLAVVAALLARLALDPVLGNRLPFLLFCLAVVAVAWYGGFGPSFVSLILGILACLYFVAEPRHSLEESVPAHQVHIVGFLFLGVTIGIFSEATQRARRRAEAHAREADRRREDLEDEVSERGRLEQEMQQQADALAAADQHKDEFLAMLGHELRNPLAPLRNAVEVMRSLDLTDRRLVSLRDAIDRQVAHLTHLVDDLLDVGRISQGKISLLREPVQVSHFIAQAVETSHPLLEARSHHLALDIPPEPVWILGDSTRLAQVFANLLNNAAKYTPNGGQIWLSARQEEGQVVVRVADNGVGIAADVLPRIFELFTQADRTLDRAEGGLGIGLTLVKALIVMHGGQIEASSAGTGQGSEFVVRLPVMATAPQPEAHAESTPVPTGPSRRVLAVDDNVDAVESLAQLLGLHGHEVRTAYDGPTALATAAAFLPEVVLLDIGLPRMDGYEVARRLRQQPGLEQTFLVAVTGYAMEQDRRQAHAAGFDAHLVKPADVTAIHQLLAGAPVPK